MPRMDQYDVKATPAPADLVLIIDVEDGSQSADGTTKLATVGSFPGGGGGGAVASVFGRTGVVAAQTGDYTAAQVGAVSTAAEGAANGVATLDGTTHVPAAQIPQLAQYNPIGLTGAQTPTSYAGGTVSGHPLSGTWTQGQWVVDETGKIYVCVAGGTPGTWRRVGSDPWQFFVDDYAKGDGQMLYDVAMNGTTAVLTASGLPAPAAPTVANAGTGGTVLAGVYQVIVTYVNRFGETLGSASSSTTTSGSTSTITVSSPAPWTNATSYYVYCTQPGGSTYTRQQALGSPTPLRTNYVITAPPTSSGATPPASNTSASSPFQSTDVNKVILVPSAGGFVNVPLVSHIASYQSAQQVTLANASTRAVTGQGAIFGTDDTAAIQQCLNDAVAYAETAGSEEAQAEVIFGGKIYCVAGLPGGTYQNAQIQIPFINPMVGPKINLSLLGPGPALGPVHWQQPNPPAAGCTIASIYYNDSGSGIGPPPNVVIGGPVENAAQGIFFGSNGGLFSNMRVTVDGINVLAAYRSCVGGLDLFGVAQAYIKSFSYFCMAATSGAAGGWPPYQPGNANPSAWNTFGYRTPYLGNNDQNDLDTLTVYGPYFGVVYADHFTAGSVKCINTYFATCASGGGHYCTIASLSSELTYAPINNDGTAQQVLFVGSLHAENATNIVYDSANLMYGEVRFELENGFGNYYTALRTGGANIKIVAASNALGPVASPHAPSASGSPWLNGYGQDAEITVSLTGGTMTALSIDAVDQHIPANCVLWKFALPEGHTYTATYTGTLAHDVTLL